MQEHERWLKVVDRDLVKLAALCSQFDKVFEKIFHDAGHLNPFSTKFRYPTDFEIPNFQDTKNSIQRTEKIVNFVLKRIAELETGQKDLF